MAAWDIDDWENQVETGKQGGRNVELVREVLGLVEASVLRVCGRDYCGFCLEFRDDSGFCDGDGLGFHHLVQGAAVLVVTGVVARSAVKYGERAQRYVYMEAGSVAQNIYLQSESLGLGTVLIGAFRDSAVKEAFNLPADEDPLFIMPIGRRL